MEKTDSFRDSSEKAHEDVLLDVNKYKFSDSGIDMEFKNEEEEGINLSKDMEKMTEKWSTPRLYDNEGIFNKKSSGPSDTSDNCCFTSKEQGKKKGILSQVPCDENRKEIPDTDFQKCHERIKKGAYIYIDQKNSNLSSNNHEWSAKESKNYATTTEETRISSQTTITQTNESAFGRNGHNGQPNPDVNMKILHESHNDKIPSTYNHECSAAQAKKIDIEEQLQIAHPLRNFYGEDFKSESSHTDAKKTGNKTKESKKHTTTAEETTISSQRTIGQTNELAIGGNGHNGQPNPDVNMKILHESNNDKNPSTYNHECFATQVKKIEIEDQLHIAHPLRNFYGEDFESKSSHTNAKTIGKKTKKNKNYATNAEETNISFQPTISKRKSAIGGNGHNGQPNPGVNMKILHESHNDKIQTNAQQKNSSDNTKKLQLKNFKQSTNKNQTKMVLFSPSFLRFFLVILLLQNNENVINNHFQKKSKTRNYQLDYGVRERGRFHAGKYWLQRPLFSAENGITGIGRKATCLKFGNYEHFSKSLIQNNHMIHMYPCIRDPFSNEHINQIPEEDLPNLSRTLQIYNTDQNYGRDHDPTDYIHVNQSTLRLQGYGHVSDHRPGSNQTILIHRLHSNSHINQADPERSLNANGIIQTDYIHLSTLRFQRHGHVSYYQANRNHIISIHGNRTTNRPLNLDCFVDYQSGNPSLRLTDRSIARLMVEMFHFHVHINGTRRRSQRCLQAFTDNSELVSSLRLTTESIDNIYQILNSDDFHLDINIEPITYSNITTERSVPHTGNRLPIRQDLTMPEQNLLHSPCLIEGLSIPVNFEIDNRFENTNSRHTQTSSERLLLELSNCESTTSDSTTLQNRAERQIDLNYREISFGDANGEVQAETKLENTVRASSVEYLRPNSSSISQNCCSLGFKSLDGFTLPDGSNQSKKNPNSAEMDNCDDLGGQIAHISNDQNIQDSGYTSVNSDIVNITYRGRILTSFILDKDCELQEILQKINYVILEYLQEEPDLYNVQRLDHHTIKIDDDTYNISTK